MASDTLPPVKEVPFSFLPAFDARHFFCQRAPFPEQWIRQPGGMALASFDGERVQGYRMIRPCHAGHKIGPLFADSPAIEGEIINALMAHVRGDTPVFGTPDRNPATVALARTNGMEEVFGTARIFLGGYPDSLWSIAMASPSSNVDDA